MWTTIGFRTKATVVTVLGASALACGPELEVRDFELERLSAAEAEALVAPYVFTERKGVPGRSSHIEGVLTVRELPENLDRIEEVLDRYDRSATNVALRFRIVEANGFEGVDETLVDIEGDLRDVLRYEGYRLVGEALMQVGEGAYLQQNIRPRHPVIVGGREQEAALFELSVNAGRVSGLGDDATVTLDVGLNNVWGQILNTRVTVQNGRTMVLGTSASQYGGGEALILVVTPEIGPAGE